jgi:hypothetical protein
MGHKIFISYKYGDTSVQRLARTPFGVPTIVRHYVDEIQTRLKEENHINKGELDGEDLSMFKDETIASKLRDKIYDSSITIVLISPRMKDPYVLESDQWIPWEISYSLYEVERSDRVSRANALLGVVLPDVNGSCEYVITERSCCPSGCIHLNRSNLFSIIQDNTFNRKRPPVHTCARPDTIWEYPFSYMHIVSWPTFIRDMNKAIEDSIAIRDRIAEFDIRKQVR